MKLYTVEPKGNKPIIAICYDFDKTLSPTDMQAQGYIQSVNCDVTAFWRESNDLANKNGMDQNLSWMYKMVKEADGYIIPKKETLEEYGSRVKLFPGVDTWFERVNEYAKTKGIIIEHYIISSGLKEMIDGTSIAKKGVFKKVYASAFYYNDRGVAVWPAQTINFTGKTQYLFRISKGVLNVNDPAVNNYFEPDEIRIPFRNIIYIGDSDTDIPCMKLVTSNGGHAIGVYDCDSKDKTKVQKMIHDNRISYYAEADYRKGKALERIVKAIIDQTSSNEAIESIKTKCIKETVDAYDGKTIEEQKRKDLIIELDNSSSFTNTHTVVKKLKHIDWNDKEREEMYRIALINTQIKWILKDTDIADFYMKNINKEKILSEAAKEVKRLIEE